MLEIVSIQRLGYTAGIALARGMYDVLVGFSNGQTLMTGAAELLNHEDFDHLVAFYLWRHLHRPPKFFWADYVRDIFERSNAKSCAEEKQV